jgi:putative ABC transport system permease protein
LIGQFLGESLFLSGFSLVFAFALVELSLPMFGSLVGKEVIFDYIADPILLLGILLLTIAVGLVSGSYPAFFLSAFRPVQVLKGSATSGGRGWLRKGLVVIQFALSVGLIVGTVVMERQHQFLTTRNLGFDKEFLIDVRLNLLSDRTRSYDRLRQALLQNPKISSISSSSNKPGVTDHNGIQIRTPGSEQDESVGIIYVNYDYVQTLDLNVVSGRGFSADIGSDRNGILLNRSALKKLGAEFEPGHPVELFHRDRERIVPRYNGSVIGVVRDFNHRPLVDGPPRPLVFAIANSDWAHGRALVRIAPEGAGETVDFIQNQWGQLFPDQPFRFSFLDADIERVYRTEKQWQTTFTAFATLAISVACLGLFGLAAFTAERRTKEIGIRKVMGASVRQIVLLLSQEFTWLVLVANVVAWPVAYVFLDRWLQRYHYHVDLSLDMFIWSGLLALSIAWLTVAYQAVKAANTNPVDALRYE